VEEKDDYYCNESTYTNLNILFVSGLVRLDASVAPTSMSVASFDAWPTKKQLKETSRRGRKHFAQIGLPIPHWYQEGDC